LRVASSCVADLRNGFAQLVTVAVTVSALKQSDLNNQLRAMHRANKHGLAELLHGLAELLQVRPTLRTSKRRKANRKIGIARLVLLALADGTTQCRFAIRACACAVAAVKAMGSGGL